nr:immunoglobulin light chain junction region [Macaca mulatta]MPN91024.1 immunoglobulin light chain junction region [Macaca mulatta]MPN91035.1 immunoglobulin light chain junction region [Macaca mulatta]MPN91402.1 immunoglobulin light chain junction region [Macaca mulatta]MPN92182.1 immunoglobulin light chain junction region [Macaca mulatta]
CLQGYSAPLTF